MNDQNLKKRAWVYLQRPREYEVDGCDCGNNDLDWSEFRDHLWCEKCKKDFKPKHWGVFDGPVSIKVCAMLGIYFSRLNLETNEIEMMDLETGRYKN